ncbi:ESX-1 secretion-associated protein [Mycolicibacterium smegmatis]|uniref:WXG100 family type VII secretion target n=1 Tax=Mycolicibacterium smegmatis (strain MKD8) TaxID=1214915 RepID=A0A2U9PZF8_MYCSE|nr:ESX-1 secretion-associated protein [Mycolicibacterium smegmatis]AWT57199.1 hypothetical protein D806_062660 [Mycolicibacterium smegmatis MKD8]
MPPFGHHRYTGAVALADHNWTCSHQNDGQGRIVTNPELHVTPAEVRRSADQMDVVAHEASSSRTAMADGISGQTTAWKEAGTPGFAKFVDIAHSQAERLRTDLTDLRDRLRTAADVYERQDHEAGGALDSSVGGTD